MSFNELLTEAGDFGLYQKIFCIGFLWFSVVISGFTYWTNVFVLIVAPHRCRLSSNDTWENDVSHYSGVVVRECEISYNDTWREKFLDTEDSRHQLNDYLIEEPENSTWTTISCPYGWVYDFSTFYPTISTENEWVCENSWKMYMVHSCYWAGTIFGFVLFGLFSDRFGRKRAYQIFLSIAMISDLSGAFVHSRIAFIVARFFSAVGQRNIAEIAFFLGMEYTGPTKRLFVLAGFCLTWTSTSALFPLVPYLIRNWRWILIASTVPSTLGLLFSNFVPESASWLITRGRIDDASRLIQRVSKVNGRKMAFNYIKEKLEPKQVTEFTKVTQTEEVVSKDNQGEKSMNEQQIGQMKAILGLFKTPNLRKKTILLVVISTISTMCYNGNNIEISNLPFNFYLSYSIGALLELPSNICCLLLLDKIGRRWANFGFLLMAGTFGIASGLVKTDPPFLFPLALFMRTGLAGGYDTTLTLSSESFPTVVRGRGMAIIRIFTSLGSFLSPLIVSLSVYDPLLPLAIFGVLTIFAGCTTLFVPETAGQHLPHTLEEGEEYGKDQIFFFCPFIQQRTRDSTLSLTIDLQQREEENRENSGTENHALETDA